MIPVAIRYFLCLVRETCSDYMDKMTHYLLIKWLLPILCKDLDNYGFLPLPVINENVKKNLAFIERAFGTAAPDCLYQLASEVGAIISKIPKPEISRQFPL
jgi:hypothetical protein